MVVKWIEDLAIFERDHFTCQYCGLDCSSDFEKWWYANLNVDHIVPKKHGGSDDPSNRVTACRACNLYKGSHQVTSIEEAKEFVATKRKQAEAWFKKYVTKESG